MKSTHKALMFQDPPVTNGDKILKMIQICRENKENDEEVLLKYFREDPKAIYAITEGMQIMTLLVQQCTQLLLQESLKKNEAISTKKRKKDGRK